MKKLNVEKIYFINNVNNELLGIFNTKELAMDKLNNNLNLIINEKECYEFYQNSNFDNSTSDGITIISIIINNITKEIIFKNSIGFALCSIKKYCMDNNVSFEYINGIEYNFSYNKLGKINKLCCEKNQLVDNLLLKLNDDNFSIISNYINVLYYCELQNENDLIKIEYDSTHYILEKEAYEININEIKNRYDICLLDLLNSSGLKNYSVIIEQKKSTNDKKEIIKWVSIYELFADLDFTYYYSFYKILINDGIKDPFEFIK